MNAKQNLYTFYFTMNNATWCKNDCSNTGSNLKLSMIGKDFHQHPNLLVGLLNPKPMVFSY